jgi:4-hydroxybenzoate polyprenyltransferase
LTDRLGLELKAGKLLMGSDRIAENARSGKVAWLAHAADAGDDGSRKLDQAWRVGEDEEGSGRAGVRLPLDRAALSVALAYPYAKRFVAMPQAVLGVAFSFGIPMAFAAVTGEVPWQAWALLGGNLFWVLAYDTEYAMVDRNDDLRIGMKTSAITLGRYDVLAVMLFYAVYLLGNLWLLHDQGLGWPQWFSIEIAGVQAFWHFGMIYKREREGCFRAFRMNHWLGATVFAGIAWGLHLR